MKKFRYTKLQKEWLHDLKTTGAKRGEGFLHACNGWCCLGRALHVMGLKPNYREGGFATSTVARGRCRISNGLR